MTKSILISLLLSSILTGCGSDNSEPQPAIPLACYDHNAAEFTYGTFSCEEQTAPKCAFGAHNQPVPLDSSGDPLAYYCTCTGNQYACWGVEWFVKADPLPPLPVKD